MQLVSVSHGRVCMTCHWVVCMCVCGVCVCVYVAPAGSAGQN